MTLPGQKYDPNTDGGGYTTAIPKIYIVHHLVYTTKPMLNPIVHFKNVYTPMLVKEPPILTNIPSHIQLPTLLKPVMQLKATVTIVPMKTINLQDVVSVQLALVLEIKFTKEKVAVHNVNYVRILPQIKFYLVLDLLS